VEISGLRVGMNDLAHLHERSGLVDRRQVPEADVAEQGVADRRTLRARR
jgi:hypothetical protein